MSRLANGEEFLTDTLGRRFRKSLSGRELEVMHLMTSGLMTKEIAYKLGISPKTVEKHRVLIHLKTGCHSATELLRWAIRNGHVTIESIMDKPDDKAKEPDIFEEAVKAVRQALPQATSFAILARYECQFGVCYSWGAQLRNDDDRQNLITSIEQFLGQLKEQQAAERRM